MPSLQASVQHRGDVIDRLVASAEPAVAFTALAEACVPLLGSCCTADLVEDTGASYRIERPIAAAHSASPDQQTLCPCGASESQPGSADCAGLSVIVAAATVPSSARVAAGGSGYHVQVSCHCLTGQRPTDEQQLYLQHLVDRTVESVFRERVQVALDAERAQSVQLRQALDSSREIGMAVGIVMNAGRLSADQAFEVLATVSQNTNRKVRDIASELVRTGSLPRMVVDCAPAARRVPSRRL